MAALEVGFARSWWASLDDLTGAEAKRVINAVVHFLRDPDHPGLNLHPLRGDKSRRLHSFRASDDLRVLLAKQGNVYLLLEVGHHDAVYERAERLTFVSNPFSGFMGLVELDPEPGGRGLLVVTPPPGPGPLDHWGDSELAEAGFAADEIAAIRTCRSDDELLALRLPEDKISLLIDLTSMTPEQWRSPTLNPEREAEERFRTTVDAFGAVHGFSKLFSPEEALAIVTAPIEDWMVFLHPDQRTVVERRYSGPARVRGAAGTGKTVVALHRAAELARRFRDQPDGGPILFTTFITNLPPVLEHLYERLPGTRPGEVEFVNVDKLAARICRESGDTTRVDMREVDAAFAAAWRAATRDHRLLTTSGLTRRYLREEITSVIKGRGLRSLDEYLAVERTGRLTPMQPAMRRAVWALAVEWDRRMAERGTVDFPDRVRLARDHARRRPHPTYRAAIIDEAQDITLVGLQLVRALVNGPGADRPDGLLIVADGAQRIYPGGFTLRQAGIEVRGRTTVLGVNYRNTREIIGAAMAVAGREPVDDLGEVFERKDAEAVALRSGFRPVLVSAAHHDAELRFVTERIGDLVARGALGHGDVAVAVATNDQVKRVESALVGAGLPCQRLDQYDGVPSDAVKVGTHFRIKGLEFKVVFLPFLGEHDFPRPRMPGQLDSEYLEDRSRAISQLFVAMTRARDGLFVLCSGNPSDVFGTALDYFDLLEA